MEHFGLHPKLTVAQQAYVLDIKRSNGGLLGLQEQDSSQGHEQSKLRELLFASSSYSWAFIQIPWLNFVQAWAVMDQQTAPYRQNSKSGVRPK